jgi:hypothetical protein
MRTQSVLIDADLVMGTRATSRSVPRRPTSSDSSAADPSVTVAVDAGRGASLIPARLREQCAGWSTSSLDEASPVGVHCGCPSDTDYGDTATSPMPWCSDVNKDWTHKDNDQTLKDEDKD